MRKKLERSWNEKGRETPAGFINLEVVLLQYSSTQGFIANRDRCSHGLQIQECGRSLMQRRGLPYPWMTFNETQREIKRFLF